MRTCAAKVQLPSECRISHSSQSTYFDAVALYTHPRLQEAMTCAKTNGIGIRPSLTALHQVRSNESPGRKPRAMCSFTIGGLPAGRMKRKGEVSRDSKMGKGSISPNDTIGKPGSLFASWFPTFRTRPSPKPSDAAPSAWTNSSSRSGRGRSTATTTRRAPIPHPPPQGNVPSARARVRGQIRPADPAGGKTRAARRDGDDRHARGVGKAAGGAGIHGSGASAIAAKR